MNTQKHATLKMTLYEVVFGLKPSSEPVQDLTITEENTDREHSDSDDEYENQDMSFDKTDDSETLSLQSEGICIASYLHVYCMNYIHMESADISGKPRACPCYNIYVTLFIACKCGRVNQMQSNRDIVSETLLVKERGAISKEKLASDFCLQLPDWCPCLNCRDFDPQPLVPRPVPQKIGCNGKEILKLKRKAAAPKNYEVPCEKSCKKSTEAHIEAGADENDVESLIERF